MPPRRGRRGGMVLPANRFVYVQSICCPTIDSCQPDAIRLPFNRCVPGSPMAATRSRALCLCPGRHPHGGACRSRTHGARIPVSGGAGREVVLAACETLAQAGQVELLGAAGRVIQPYGCRFAAQEGPGTDSRQYAKRRAARASVRSAAGRGVVSTVVPQQRCAASYCSSQ